MYKRQVYGSDAVGGVVNFILDTDFTGVRGGLQYSFYNHDNNNSLAQEINRAAGYDPPTGITNDGDAWNANVALGGKFADGRGHASVYIDYRKIEELRRGDRDYSHCPEWFDSEGLICDGSVANERGVFEAYNSDGTPNPNGYLTLDWHEDGGDGHSFRPWDGDRYNFEPSNHIQRPDEKWNAGAFANYEINRHFDVYLEVMYLNNSPEAQIAPSGNFGSTSTINCDNPMLSEQQWETICGPATGYLWGNVRPRPPARYAEVSIYRRNVEGEPRSNQIGHNDIRMIAGLRGDIDANWRYDFYWLRAENHYQESFLNDIDVERMTHALDVIEDPETGEWVCRNPDARAEGCVPWNIFQQGAVTQEALDYISAVGVMYGTVSTEVFNFTATSDWKSYGVAIPSAREGVQAAIGVEYRNEAIRNSPDEIYRAGNLAGFEGEVPQIDDGFDVKEAFIELLVPVVQDLPGARDLTLELGYRYSDYSTAGGVSTYKGQLSYAPTPSWRLRAGYNRAIRAANIPELFYPQVISAVEGASDICAGTNPTATVDECERTGVPAELYGQIMESPLACNELIGGNPLLDPEIADTLTAGVVWTPESISGLSITLDYYNIDITEAIGALGFGAIINLCAETGEARYCSRIHRDGQYSLWLTGRGFIDATNRNIGRLVREGIDLNYNHLLGLGSAGFLAMDLMGSYLLQNRFTDPSVDFDCTGYFGSTCGRTHPIWRHRFRATWESNFRLNLSLAWRYMHSVEIDIASPNPLLANPGFLAFLQSHDLDIFPAYNWFDFAASYTFRSGIKLTAGVNNILDEDPHVPWSFYGTYDPLGRYIFGSVQFNF